MAGAFTWHVSTADVSAVAAVRSHLPAEYVGAWRRASISIADDAPRADGDVLWLQGQCYFADLRTSLSPASSIQPCTAFSGQVSWVAPQVTFLRDLDMTQAPVEDRARLAIESGVLIESGAVAHEGRLIPYVETWTRVAGSGGMRCVLDGFDRDGRLSMRFVEMDGVAIVLLDERERGGGFAAAEFMRSRTGWLAVRHLGTVRIAPPPDVSTCADSNGPLLLPASSDAMWASRNWHVRELSQTAISQ